MSSKYKFVNDGHIYFVSFSVVYWIDLFTRTDYCKTIFESWSHCEKEKGLELHAYCIMPSHIHMIIGSNKDPLEGIMRDFKSYTSRKLREVILNHSGESRKEWMLWMMRRAGEKSSHHHGFQLWQEGNHPIELSSPKIAKQKLDYTHNNPVEAGLVHRPEDWRYSSATNYMQMKSEREVILLGPFYNQFPLSGIENYKRGKLDKEFIIYDTKGNEIEHDIYNMDSLVYSKEIIDSFSKNQFFQGLISGGVDSAKAREMADSTYK